MKVVAITKSSPFYGEITPGADLVAVNGHPVSDEIDFHFYNTEDKLRLDFFIDGKKKIIKIDDAYACGDLGLEFEKTKIKICNNNCIFCFVHQQPKGMRRSLYIKDDDYRFSFTHGNFISLSGMTEADFARIIEQRLSPLYISVHSTDDKLRRCIFQNEKLPRIIPALKKLTSNGITVHTQTVICTGINDGEHLERTIEDLALLYPGVSSLAVVPVGLTKYRKRLPDLRSYSGKEADQIVKFIHKTQKRFQKLIKTRFVYAADEFYLLAGRKFPPLSEYEDMPQFENGIGMARQFITGFNRRKRWLPGEHSAKLRIGIVTGRSAERFMKSAVMPAIDRIRNLKTSLYVVDNEFWGDTVTVTGLLTGGDILKRIRNNKQDVLLLPPNCLNTDDLFLDNLTLDEFTKMVGCPVLTGSYDLVKLIRRAFEMRNS
ncbi:MAG: DUF512 domain-containing protein [candidate division Zixibacteria bacterium]